MTDPFEMEHHSFTKMRSLPFMVCRKCGLIRLHNFFTEWAVKHGCNSDDHPQYQWARVELVRQWQQRRG
jgi:hypothetical protein